LGVIFDNCHHVGRLAVQWNLAGQVRVGRRDSPASR
jgi:hypothetical protein